MDGSIRDARRAGAQLATTATPPSNSATPTYVSGSTRETPNNSDSSNRLAATAPAMPTVTPATTSSIPRPTTCRTMLADVAPSAVRMPISRTRSATPPEMTPYRPTAASSRAATANASITTNANRRCDADAEINASIDATFWIGWLGSTDQTARLTSGASDAASRVVRTTSDRTSSDHHHWSAST